MKKPLIAVLLAVAPSVFAADGSEIFGKYQAYSQKAYECMAAELGGEGGYDKENCPKTVKSLQAVTNYCLGKKIKSQDQKACEQIRKEIEEICEDGADFCSYVQE